jgi:hypothetical protein
VNYSETHKCALIPALLFDLKELLSSDLFPKFKVLGCFDSNTCGQRNIEILGSSVLKTEQIDIMI